MSLFGRWRERGRPAPVLDPPGYRLPPRPAPPPPAALSEDRAPAPFTGPSAPSMKLGLADGSMQDLPPDPELAARAEYLIKSMLPPAPPPPPPAP
jgi:hypothetical protein